jgi:hypothetical protein
MMHEAPVGAQRPSPRRYNEADDDEGLGLVSVRRCLGLGLGLGYGYLRITVPGVDGSADHLKPSINARESYW